MELVRERKREEVKEKEAVFSIFREGIRELEAMSRQYKDEEKVKIKEEEKEEEQVEARQNSELRLILWLNLALP